MSKPDIAQSDDSHSGRMTQHALGAAGFEIENDAYELLGRFVALLREENSRVNLTAIREEVDIWPLHICDSLTLLSLIDACGAKSLLDLGTGGGIPGLPIACVKPDLHVTLIDATRKKIAAVERMIAALGLTNAKSIWTRSESLAHDRGVRESFDAVAARAVGRLPFAIEYAAGLVRPGGVCWFFKGTDAAAEIEHAESAAAACNMELLSTQQYSVPRGHGERQILQYVKTAPLDDRLPRLPSHADGTPL